MAHGARILYDIIAPPQCQGGGGEGLGQGGAEPQRLEALTLILSIYRLGGEVCQREAWRCSKHPTVSLLCLRWDPPPSVLCCAALR